jgi:peptidoglycan/xylan/chitin deacetylase (PgdA/CDA1 family)
VVSGLSSRGFLSPRDRPARKVNSSRRRLRDKPEFRAIQYTAGARIVPQVIWEAVKRVTGAWAGPALNIVLRITRRRAGVALCYHTIDIRQGDPGQELVPTLARERFARQLRHLQRFYDVVSAEDFLDAVRCRRRGQRFPVCLTFDDDAPQHLRHALPELSSRGVPATFFLCGAALQDGGASFWWQRLQRAVDRGVPMSEIASLLAGTTENLVRDSLDIHRIADVVTDLPAGARIKVSSELLHLAGPDPPEAVISADHITALHEAGFGIGFHTLRHDDLTALDDSALKRALTDGRPEMEELAEQPLDTLAYPHGRVDARVVAAARESGFRFAFTSVSAAVTARSDPLLLDRVEPVVPSHGAFALRVARALLLAGRRGG